RTVDVTGKEAFEQFLEGREEAFPMFYVRNDKLFVCSTDAPYTPKRGDTVICAVRDGQSATGGE
ncbi:MAG: hypothetical protein ABEN55_08790, partial [Bradymonadaceae bacterium]